MVQICLQFRESGGLQSLDRMFAAEVEANHIKVRRSEFGYDATV